MTRKNIQPLAVKSLPIKDWPKTERPREKLLRSGASPLADAELLAIFIRTGMPGKTALDIAREILLQAGSLRRVLNMSKSDFCRIHGLGEAKYVQFQAALELGRRYLKERIEKGSVIEDPKASKDYLTMTLRDKTYEAFYVIFLDSKHRVIHTQELFRGTIDYASVPVREVVKEALKHNASSMVVAHNHPSGVAEPSAADLALTRSLYAALNMVGVRLLDHFIIGELDVISFAEIGKIN